MDVPDMTASVVSYNTRDLLRRCLRSLGARRTDGEVALDVVVVDNGSTDGSVEMVRSEFPWVRLREATENLGYGRANNLALEGAFGRYFLILNSDTEVPAGTLAQMRDFLDARPEVGAAAPRLVLPNGRTQSYRRKDLRAWSLLCEQLSLGLLARNGEPDTPQNAEQLCGAALLVRLDLYQSVGGFDPAFFMYFEDVDLCARLRRTGSQLWYLPSVTIRHNLGGSSQCDWRTRARMVAAHNHSACLYFLRHGGPSAEAQARAVLRLGAGLRRAFWGLAALVRPAARDRARLFREVWRHPF